MRRFKHYTKNGCNFRYLINDGRKWLLLHFTPHNNEFERGLKYILCEEWYNEDHGYNTRHYTGYKFSSIKQAEEWLLNNGYLK